MTERDDEDRSNRPGPRNKVARIIDEYDLDGMGGRLERSWTGQGGPRRSLRDLASMVNRELLEVAMKRANLNPIENDVRSTYEVLAGEADSGSRVQKRRELERQGVDVSRLEDDFVSHQAIHSYLRDHRDVTRTDPDDAERIETQRDHLGRLRSRAVAVSTNAVERLRDAGLLAIDGFDIIVDIRITCDDCGRSYDVDDFLGREGCDCKLDEE